MTTKLYQHQQALLDSARETSGSLQAHGRVLRGNPPRSISDDDLCATCAKCIDHPRGDLSLCSEGWPTIINPDGYITECAQHQPRP